MKRSEYPRLRRAVAAILIAPLFALMGGCGGDPVGVEGEGEVYLDEMFNFTVENDIQYGSALDENGGEEALLLDLFQPTDDRPLRAAVIWLHGGGFQAGHKGEMTEFARRFAQRGFVSASANYRLRENAVFDYVDPDDELGEEVKRDAQHDIQAAVRWLRANAGELRVDPDRIFVVGYSAGGTTALRVASRPDDPGVSGNSGPSSSVTAAAAISGSPEAEMFDEASGPSLLFIHGENDTKVPIANVEAMCSSVDRCRLVGVPEGQHNMISVAKEVIITESATFLHAEANTP